MRNSTKALHKRTKRKSGGEPGRGELEREKKDSGPPSHHEKRGKKTFQRGEEGKGGDVRQCDRD